MDKVKCKIYFVATSIYYFLPRWLEWTIDWLREWAWEGYYNIYHNNKLDD